MNLPTMPTGRCADNHSSTLPGRVSLTGSPWQPLWHDSHTALPILLQTSLDAELFSLAWSGDDDQWVWAVTTGTNDMLTVSARRVYWSSDHGASMHDKTPEMIQLITAQAGAGFEDFASINQVIVHDQDPSKVLLWGDETFSFSSTDGGATLSLVDVPAGTKGVSHLIKPCLLYTSPSPRD